MRRGQQDIALWHEVKRIAPINYFVQTKLIYIKNTDESDSPVFFGYRTIFTIFIMTLQIQEEHQ